MIFKKTEMKRVDQRCPYRQIKNKFWILNSDGLVKICNQSGYFPSKWSMKIGMSEIYPIEVAYPISFHS